MKTYTKAELFAIMDKILSETDSTKKDEWWCTQTDLYGEAFNTLKEVLNEIEETVAGNP